MDNMQEDLEINKTVVQKKYTGIICALTFVISFFSIFFTSFSFFHHIKYPYIYKYPINSYYPEFFYYAGAVLLFVLISNFLFRNKTINRITPILIANFVTIIIFVNLPRSNLNFPPQGLTNPTFWNGIISATPLLALFVVNVFISLKYSFSKEVVFFKKIIAFVGYWFFIILVYVTTLYIMEIIKDFYFFKI